MDRVIQVEKATFTPAVVFSTSGAMGDDAQGWIQDEISEGVGWPKAMFSF